MANQAAVNGHGSGSPAGDVGEGIADLAHDLLALAELQYELLVVDIREGSSKSKFPAAVLAGTAILALASLPVALLGLAWLLVDYAEFSRGAAFLTVAATALLIAAGLAWWAYRGLHGALSMLARSRAELSANIHWIKQALKQRKGSAGAASAEYESPARFTTSQHASRNSPR